VSKVNIVDQAPADGAKSLADGAVDMACIFGGESAKAAGEVGTPIMTKEQKVEAGIGSFDVISVTEKVRHREPGAAQVVPAGDRRGQQGLDRF
jgi:taurine transport system substrate-binding protein